MRTQRTARHLGLSVLGIVGVLGGVAGGLSAPRSAAAQPVKCAVDAALSKSLRTRSSEELAKSLFVLQMYGSNASQVTDAQGAANKALYGEATPGAIVAKWKPAGVILFNRNPQDPTRSQLTATNIQTAEQLARFSADLRRIGGDPKLLVSVDQEGGRVNRLESIVGPVPSAATVGASEAATQTQADATATSLRTYGINVDYAPVADVVSASTKSRSVIGDRSYGSDSALVASRVGTVVGALQNRGIASVAKHWPGHGTSSVDSHQSTPVLDFSDPSVAAENLAPFTSAINNGVAGIMVGHLSIPAWDPSGRPATISQPILKRLRDSFCGAIFTDSLWMGGVRKFGTDGTIPLGALRAGADVLLMPVNVRRGVTTIAANAEKDPLLRERLVDAAIRVETLRQRFAVDPKR
jgi:beta-N-acetylhexosaminidase